MYEDTLNNITWSFSSVNTYITCPKSFKLIYIDKKDKVSNAFGEWGSYMHSLLEKYFNSEAEIFELAAMYKDGYKENVPSKFPYFAFCDLSEKYYESGLDYLNRFEGLSDKYEVVGVEQKIELEIDGKKFIGFIDLILKNKETGDYIIVDHKSKSGFKSKKEKEHYLIQLYLYSIYVKERYGKYPVELKFNMFRADKWETEAFDEKKLEKAKVWFSSTVDLIYFDETFPMAVDDFYCQNLCSVRHYCTKE